MASQFHSGGSSGGRKSSIGLINVLSSQNATLRDENTPSTSSSRWSRSPSADVLPDTSVDMTLPDTPEVERVKKRVEFYTALAARVEARSASIRDVETALSEYPHPDTDEMLVLLSPAGLPLQQELDAAIAKMAEVFPQAMSHGSSLAFKAAMIPLYEAQRNKKSFQLQQIAQDIVSQFGQENFSALAWIKHLAKIPS